MPLLIALVVPSRISRGVPYFFFIISWHFWEFLQDSKNTISNSPRSVYMISFTSIPSRNFIENFSRRSYGFFFSILSGAFFFIFFPKNIWELFKDFIWKFLQEFILELLQKILRHYSRSTFRNLRRSAFINCSSSSSTDSSSSSLILFFFLIYWHFPRSSLIRTNAEMSS